MLTASQLRAVRKVVERGMRTDFSILKRITIDSPYGDDEEQSFATAEVVKGWLREVPAGTIDVVSGVMANVGVYRLFLPVGTDINPGDRVGMDGEVFIVQDTNQASEYQATLRISLRRAE